MTRVETVPIPQISKALSVHLLQLYFRFFHPACPILHPATFFKRLRQNTISDFLLYAMYAVSAKYSDDPDIAENPPWMSGEKYAIYARSKLVGWDSPTLDYVVSLIILCKSEYERGKAHRGWLYGGMCIRTCHFLGFHKVDQFFMEQSGDQNDSQNLKHPITDDPLDLEIIRRLWWTCYNIDTYSGTATGRPYAIQDQNTFCSFPMEDGTWNEDPNNYIFDKVEVVDAEPFFTSYIKLLTVMSKVGKFIHTPRLYKTKCNEVLDQQINFLDSMLQTWKSNLPEELQDNALEKPENFKKPSYLTMTLHSIMHGITITLHSAQVGTPAQQMASTERCKSAANSIYEIMIATYKKWHLRASIYSCSYTLYLACTIFLDDMVRISWDEIMEGDSKFAQCIKLLQDFQSYWSMTSQYLGILKQLHATKRQNVSSILTNSTMPQPRLQPNYSPNLDTDSQLSQDPHPIVSNAQFNKTSHWMPLSHPGYNGSSNSPYSMVSPSYTFGTLMPTSSGPPMSMATTIPNSAPLPDSEFLSNEMAWMTFNNLAPHLSLYQNGGTSNNNQQNYMRQSSVEVPPQPQKTQQQSAGPNLVFNSYTGLWTYAPSTDANMVGNFTQLPPTNPNGNGSWPNLNMRNA
jgi:hypothetical protein